jgi:hypothetical protein
MIRIAASSMVDATSCETTVSVRKQPTTSAKAQSNARFHGKPSSSGARPLTA